MGPAQNYGMLITLGGLKNQFRRHGRNPWSDTERANLAPEENDAMSLKIRVQTQSCRDYEILKYEYRA